MNLPKSFFEPNTFNLTGYAKSYLKDILKQQMFPDFNELVGYTPHPDDICPPPRWSYPFGTHTLNRQLNKGIKIGPPWPEPSIRSNYNLGYPDPNDVNPFPWPWPIGPWVRDFLEERMFDDIKNAPLRKNSYNFIDTIKRENLAIEVLSELKVNLSDVQKNIIIKLKQLQ